jgi:hypothetical protein
MAKKKQTTERGSSAPDPVVVEAMEKIRDEPAFVEIEVVRHVNNVRRGDRLRVEDTATTRALIANGYYRLVM